MDSGNIDKFEKTGLSPLSDAQMILAREIAGRYELDIPSALMQNPNWAVKFLNLFSYNTELPENDRMKTGWKRIITIRNDYYYWTDAESTARKLDLTRNDVLYMIDILVNYAKDPMTREGLDIRDPEAEAYLLEEKRAYAE